MRRLRRCGLLALGRCLGGVALMIRIAPKQACQNAYRENDRRQEQYQGLHIFTHNHLLHGVIGREAVFRDGTAAEMESTRWKSLGFIGVGANAFKSGTGTRLIQGRAGRTTDTDAADDLLADANGKSAAKNEYGVIHISQSRE